MIRSILKISLPLLIATIFVFLPYFANPDLFLNRNNDLTEFFWPIYYFVKDQITNNNTYPLWNSLFLSGTPLVTDPQAPLFYIPNILFLVVPLNSGFLISAFVHIFISGVSGYLLAKHGFGYSTKVAIILGIFYLTSPKITGYIEAGHIGLINSWPYIPLVILATLKLAKTPKFNWSIVLAISMAGLFYNHSVTFLIMCFLIPVVFITYLNKNFKLILHSSLYLAGGVVLAIGLTAISFLPQFTWQEYTTRSLLYLNPQVHPHWLGEGEFLTAVFAPWKLPGGVKNLDTEKWIPLGLTLSLLACVGFLKLNFRKKLLVTFSVFCLTMIALSSSSIFYDILIRQSWYSFMRVPTRVWFIVLLIVIYLAGLALDYFEKTKKLSCLVYIFSALVISESLFLSWQYIQKPMRYREQISSQVYEIFKNDTDHYRVLCLNLCLRQNEAAVNKLEMINGYSTLTQLNYYKQSWKLTGGYWDYYTLLTPPPSVYLFQILKPDAKLLGEYNTKYVISPYQLTDKAFDLVKKIDNYYIYLNTAYKPRANVPISYYSANKITLDTTNTNQQTLVLSEVYSPGWKAYLNGNELTQLIQNKNSLREITIQPNTKYVEIRYEPQPYLIGKKITFSTIAFLIGYLVIKYKPFL